MKATRRLYVFTEATQRRVPEHKQRQDHYSVEQVLISIGSTSIRQQADSSMEAGVRTFCDTEDKEVGQVFLCYQMQIYEMPNSRREQTETMTY